MLRSLLHRLRRDERGVSLVELQIAMVIGIVVIAGAFMLLERAVKAQNRTELRVDAAARGRVAMDDLSRQIRSQLCLRIGKKPLIEATATSVTFYSSTGAPASSGLLPVRIQKITWETSGSRGKIVQRLWAPTVYTSATNIGFPDIATTPATSTRTIVDDVDLVGGTLFKYDKFNPDQSASVTDANRLQAVTAPVSAANLPLVVRMTATFSVFPRQGSDAKLATTLSGAAYFRTADATNPLGGPACV